MSMNVGKEVAALQRMTVNELRARYAEVFGDATRTGNKAWLVKRIAWRLQAMTEGGLSERARQRAEELANDADIRMSPPKAKPATPRNEQRTVTAAVRFADDVRRPRAAGGPPRAAQARDHPVRTAAMALVTIGLAFGDSGSFELPVKAEYTRRYIGRSNNPFDSPLSIARDRLCPKPGQPAGLPEWMTW